MEPVEHLPAVPSGEKSERGPAQATRGPQGPEGPRGEQGPPGPRGPKGSSSGIDKVSLAVAVIALVVSGWVGWTANNLMKAANDISAAANRKSDEALEITKDAATASVSVTVARLAHSTTAFEPIELELQVTNTGERDADDVTLEFGNRPALTFADVKEATNYLRTFELRWELAPTINRTPLRLVSLARQTTGTLSAKTNLGIARFVGTSPTRVRVEGVVRYVTAQSKLEAKRAFCFSPTSRCLRRSWDRLCN